jgi:hypothetical protein
MVLFLFSLFYNENALLGEWLRKSKARMVECTSALPSAKTTRRVRQVVVYHHVGLPFTL